MAAKEKKQCKAFNKKGARCRNKARYNNYCKIHAKERYAKGGWDYGKVVGAITTTVILIEKIIEYFPWGIAFRLRRGATDKDIISEYKNELRGYLEIGDIENFKSYLEEQGLRAQGRRSRVPEKLLDDFTTSLEILWTAEKYINDMPPNERKRLGLEALAQSR